MCPGASSKHATLADGIFLDYHWSENMPHQSALAARGGDGSTPDRRLDVYQGIDVFGRGTYAGGKWNVAEALRVCDRVVVSPLGRPCLRCGWDVVPVGNSRGGAVCCHLRASVDVRVWRHALGGCLCHP